MHHQLQVPIPALGDSAANQLQYEYFEPQFETKPGPNHKNGKDTKQTDFEDSGRRYYIPSIHHTKVKKCKTMKVAAAVELNNASIDELKRGNIIPAFSLLWNASESLSSANKNVPHVEADAYAYHFSWENISTTELISPTASRAYEGGVDFLSLRFLRVLTRDTHKNLDSNCSCGFSWVIWYNLGILCTVLGTILGEVAGRGLLECGFELLENARRRVDLEPPSQHWVTVKLTLLANQACIYRELQMKDEMNVRLGSMACSLILASSFLDHGDWINFYFTIQALSENSIAAAA